MSIYIGEYGDHNIGDIRGPRINAYQDEFHNGTIKYVFNGNTLIWPVMNVSLFWYSFWSTVVSTNQQYECSPLKETFKIYIRSCNQGYNTGYPFIIKATDSWIKVNGNSNEKKIDANTSPSKDTADAILEVEVESNSNSSDRVGTITLVQIDENNKIKTLNISILQEADVLDDVPDYSNASIIYYTDSTFSTTTQEYPNANAISGTTDIYFKIKGQISTITGVVKDCYYGENSKDETSEYLEIYFGDPISSLDTIEYLNQGKWHAKFSWEDNNNSSNITSIKPYVRNLSLSQNDISVNGGTTILYFDVYKVGYTPSRTSIFNITLDGNPSWVGDISESSDFEVGQDGIKIELNTNSTVINSVKISAYNNKYGDEDNISWITIGDTKINNNGKLYSTITIDEQEIIDEYKFSDLSSPTYNSTNTEGYLTFKLYSTSGSVDSRSVSLIVRYINVTNNIELRQNGKTSSSGIEITSLKNNKDINSEINSEINGSDVFITFISNPRYNGTYWVYSFTMTENSPISSGENMIIDPKINVDKLPSNGITKDSSQYYLTFSIGSGQVNSSDRSVSVTINYQINDVIVTEKSTKISQLGSTSTESIIYNNSENCSISSVYNDELNFWKIENNKYYYYIRCSENTNYDSNNILGNKLSSASITLSEPTDDFQVEIPFIISLMGYPLYEGKERNITFYIQCYNLHISSSLECIQEGKESVQGNLLVPCTTIDENLLSYTCDASNEVSIEENKYISLKSLSKSLPNQWNGILEIEPNYKVTNYNIYSSINNNTNSSITIDYYAQNLNINTYWTQSGSPLNIKITLKYSDLSSKSLSFTQESSVQSTNYSTIGKNINILANVDWLSISTNGIGAVVSNPLLTTRSVDITFSTIDCPIKLSKTQTLIQSANTNPEYQFTIEQTSNIVIDELFGKLTSITISGTSMLENTGDYINVKVKSCTNDNITYNIQNTSGYEYAITISAKEKVDVTTLFSIELVQEGSNDTITISGHQVGYQFYYDTETIMYYKGNTKEIFPVSVKDSKNGMVFVMQSVDFTINSYPSFVSAPTKTSNNITLTCNKTNTSTTSSIEYLKLTQDKTGRTLNIPIQLATFHDLELTNKEFHLYTDNDGDTVNINSADFYSNINGVNYEPYAKFIKDLIEDIDINGPIYNTKLITYNVNVSNNSISHSTSYLFDQIYLYTKIEDETIPLGYIPVYKHSFYFSFSSISDNNRTKTVTTSSKSNESQIINIYSFCDYNANALYEKTIDYKISSSNYFTFKTNSSDNTLTITNKSANSSTEKRIETITLTQYIGNYATGLILSLTIEQSTPGVSLESNYVEFDYDMTKTVNLIGTVSGTVELDVTNGGSWISASISGNTISITSSGGNTKNNLGYNAYSSKTGNARTDGIVEVIYNGQKIGEISCQLNSYYIEANDITLGASGDVKTINVTTYKNGSKLSSNSVTYSKVDATSSWFTINNNTVVANSTNLTGKYRSGLLKIVENNSLLFTNITVGQSGYGIDGEYNNETKNTFDLHFYYEEEKTISNLTIRQYNSETERKITWSGTIQNNTGFVTVTQSNNSYKFNIDWTNLVYETNFNGLKVYTDHGPKLTGKILLISDIDSNLYITVNIYLHSYQLYGTPSIVTNVSQDVVITSTMDNETSVSCTNVHSSNMIEKNGKTIFNNDETITLYTKTLNSNLSTNGTFVIQQQDTSNLQIHIDQNLSGLSITSHNQ